MPDPITARYRDAAGGAHDVVIQRTPEGRWRVLDIADTQTALVETLTGHDDRRAQAEALARDYATEQQAFQAGLRDDPLPGKPRTPHREQRCAA